MAFIMSINDTLDYWLVPIVLTGGFLGLAVWLAIAMAKLWRWATRLYARVHVR